MIARALVSVVAVRHYGFTLSAVARALNVSKQTIFRGVTLGEHILPLVEGDIVDLLATHGEPLPRKARG